MKSRWQARNGCDGQFIAKILIQWNVDYPNVNYPERGPPLSPSRDFLSAKMAKSSCNVSIAKNPKKQKWTVLSIEDKLQICKKGKSITITSLAKEYDVGKSTISDIKRNEFKEYTTRVDSMDLSSSRKTMKDAQNKQLDTALYLWFAQK